MNWRTILARLPLPMLALAASYGVWSFNLLFVPWWVAFVSAAAFELVYVGLSVEDHAIHNRRRASWIAVSAVAVSVLYNVASGLFHRRPELLEAPPLWLDALLAVMHGLPLAVVAYAVASLLLHKAGPATMPEPVLTFARPAEPQAQPRRADGYQCPTCEAPLTLGQYGSARRRGYCRACKP